MVSTGAGIAVLDEVLDGAVHALLVIVKHVGGAVDEEVVVLAVELIEHVGGRGIEAVRVTGVVVLATKEIGAGDIVSGRAFFDADVVGVGPANAKGADALVVGVVGPLPGEAGAPRRGKPGCQ